MKFGGRPAGEGFEVKDVEGDGRFERAVHVIGSEWAGELVDQDSRSQVFNALDGEFFAFPDMASYG